MNNQEKVLSLVYDTPGNISDIQYISKWTKLSAKSVYRATSHLLNRGAIKKQQDIFIEKNHPPIRKIKIIITPKTRSKALWILNKNCYN